MPTPRTMIGAPGAEGQYSKKKVKALQTRIKRARKALSGKQFVYTNRRFNQIAYTHAERVRAAKKAVATKRKRYGKNLRRG